MASWTQFMIVTNEEEEEYDEVFAHKLDKLAHEIGLPEPLFKGRMLPSEVPGGMERWLFHAKVRGREVDPRTDDITFIKAYDSWEHGLHQAIKEALSRTLGVYQDEIPEDSEFYHFGRRDGLGAPFPRENRDGMPPYAIQLERMENHLVFLEATMGELMGRVRNVEIQGGNCKDEAGRLRAEVEQLRREREQLDDEKDKLKNEVNFTDALLLAKNQEAVKMLKRADMLEKQLKPPSP